MSLAKLKKQGKLFFLVEKFHFIQYFRPKERSEMA